MPRAADERDAWKRMILSSMPLPAWLGPDAPDGDVVLCSRARILRNLAGFRFPATASDEELRSAMAQILAAASASGMGLQATKGLTQAERDYLVGCRLVSPDFEWTRLGRALLTDDSGALSVMVNEEDHLRVQALTAGWSIDNALGRAKRCVVGLGRSLTFASSPAFGILAASPFNTGAGRRLSAMFHLIGLAHSKRLPQVLLALGDKEIATRGLFGESSRAIGAFVQVSHLGASEAPFVGACEYLMDAEREARSAVPRETVSERASSAVDFAVGSRTISLEDALRVLAWARWSASVAAEGLSISVREVDALLTSLDPRPDTRDGEFARQRASSLRSVLEPRRSARASLR